MCKGGFAALVCGLLVFEDTYCIHIYIHIYINMCIYIYIHAPLYLMISYETQYIASMPEGWFTVSLFSFPPRVGCSSTSSRNGASGPEKSSNFPANQGSQWWNRRAEDLQSQAWIVQDWKERVGEVSEMLRNMTNRNDFCRNQSIQGKDLHGSGLCLQRVLDACRWVPPRPFRQDEATAYRVLKGDLFKNLVLTDGLLNVAAKLNLCWTYQRALRYSNNCSSILPSDFSSKCLPYGLLSLNWWVPFLEHLEFTTFQQLNCGHQQDWM